MGFLVNKSGITVEVDDASECQRLVEKEGFRTASKAEVHTYLSSRNLIEGESREGEIFFSSVPSTCDGYGMSKVALSEALAKLDITLNETSNEQDIGFGYNHPHILSSMPTKEKLLYTMIESTKIPEFWVDQLKEATEIFVPSKFCKEAFKTRGIKTTVVPLGYNSEAFYYKKKKKKKIFSFLHYESLNTRKGWDILFQAFNEEFQHTEPVELIMKTVRDTLPLPLPRSQYPNIRVLMGKYSLEKLRELIYDADCFVFPSRGEGFGLTPLENLACGTPVIVPNGSGMSEYFDKRYFYECKIKGPVPALYDEFKGMDVGDMIQPDKKDLKKKMRYVYEHQKEAMEMAKKGSKWVRKNWTIDETAKKFKKIFDRYKNGKTETKRKLSSKPRVKVKGIHELVNKKTRFADDLTVVIPIYGQVEYVKKAIETLPKKLSIICVDDKSPDTETIEYLKSIEKRKNIKVIYNKRNLGFARTCNRGVRAVRTKYVCLMNSDVSFTSNEWIDNCIKKLNKDKRVGVLGIRLILPDSHMLQHGGMSVVETEKYIVPLHRWAEMYGFAPEYSKYEEVDFVTGAFWVLRTELYSRLKGFDCIYGRGYYEDADLCVRIRNEGYKIMYNGEVWGYHPAHKSFDAIDFDFQAANKKNRETFNKRNASLLKQWMNEKNK